MPLIKMGPAARRARMGSATTISRALRAAGVTLVTLSPGVFAVEEADLKRFLQLRQEAPPAAPPKPRPKPTESNAVTDGSTKKPAVRKRRQ